jgi:antitoxin MazE
MKVARWGNSLAVRLPSSVVAAMQLQEGDEIQMHPKGDHEFEVARDRSRMEAIARLRELQVEFPPDFKFDRDEANAR